MTTKLPNVLIVDDKPANLIALESLLGSLDANLIKANSGNEALGIAAAEELALILMDVNMPGMDGYEVINMLDGLNRTRHVPVILITAAYQDEHHRLQGYRSGAVDYIEKPVNNEILHSKVIVFLDLFRANQQLNKEIERRKQAEKHLQLTQFAVDHVGDAVYLIDPDSRFLYVNHAATEMLGFSADEFLSMSVADIDPWFPREAWVAIWGKLKHESSQIIESLHKTRCGQEIPVEIHATRFAYFDQECVIALATDISERIKTQEQLGLLSKAVSASPASVVITDTEGSIQYVNPKFEQITGYRSEEVLGQNPRVLQSGLTPFKVYEQLWETISSGKEWRGELCNQRKDGSNYWESASISPLLNEATGEITHFIAVKEDITARREAEGQLRQAASVFKTAREGIMITDSNGMILDVNDAFENITGYTKGEVLGKNPRILNSGQHNKEFYQAMWQSLTQKGHWYSEIWNRRKNGEIFAERQTITSVVDPEDHSVRYISLFSDITWIKEHEKHLEHIAHYDALTQLPNRVLLADRLQQAMLQTNRRKQMLALAFIDLDGFKEVNDSYGHEAGDQLLIELADRMKNTVRDGDTVSRVGGDEFVAVLSGLNGIEDSVTMINRLLKAVDEPVINHAAALQVSASIGVSFFPQAEEIDGEQLLRQADHAMYQAKQAGKNRYHIFDQEQDRSVRGHFETLERIGQALKNDEFVLYYQPKVNMRSGQIAGAEALIRWQHPDKGILSPASFLPVIDEHQLVVDIGDWVISKALQQMDLWRESGFELSVSVNIHARQLQQDNFVGRLQSIINKYPQVNPENLKLEVIESCALEDMSKVSKIIEDCAQLGVLFSLDDFGTGYSSLTYLKRLEVDELKIDQSFVRDMLDDPEDLAILEGVIGLAAAFRRHVIAEGVESNQHGELLIQLGCDLAQGYGIARPMPADQLPDWTESWRPPETWTNCKIIGHEDRPLLYGMVEHRAWIEALKRNIDGLQDEPPPMDHHQCRFGVLIDQLRENRSDSVNRFQQIDPLHQQVHKLGAEICQFKETDNGEELKSRMDELYGVRDRLVDKLKQLLRDS